MWAVDDAIAWHHRPTMAFVIRPRWPSSWGRSVHRRRRSPARFSFKIASDIDRARARRKRRFRTTLGGMILGQIDPQHNNFKILNNSGRTQGQIHGRKDHESAETAETSQRHISASYGPMAVILHPRAITLRVLSTVGLSLAILWWFCQPGGRLKSNVL